MLRIWTSIWGAPPPEVTMEIMYHDFEELFIGDMPHWTHCQPKFRDLAEELNHEIRKELGAPLETFNWRIRLVDQIEAIEFMLDEVLLGNYILQDKLHGLARKVYKALLELPVEEATKIYAYFDDMGNIGLLKEREHDTI
jgi:5'-deoxynucleotidase YfbR-like HD superfamily hydrolase